MKPQIGKLTRLPPVLPGPQRDDPTLIDISKDGYRPPECLAPVSRFWILFFATTVLLAVILGLYVRTNR